MKGRFLWSEPRGRVHLVRIANPPDQLFSVEMLPELLEVCEEIEKDDGALVAVFTGEHDILFLSHLDPIHLEMLVDRPELFETPSGELAVVHQAFLRLSRLPALTIAAINGHAWGAGCELALACDLRLMVDRPETGIAMLEATLGLTPGAGAAYRLRRLVGPAGAFHILATARAIGPHRALEMGLVNELLPEEGFVDAAIDRAQRLTFHTRESIANLRKCIFGGDRDAEEAFRLEQEVYVAGLRSETARRRARIMLEQRTAGTGPGERAAGMPSFLLAPVLRRRPSLIIQALDQYFEPERARGISRTYRLDIEGRKGGSWTVEVDDGRLRVEKDGAAPADVTMIGTPEAWVDFITGRTGEIELFTSGRLRVYGDLMEAFEFESLFLHGEPSEEREAGHG